MNWKEFLKPTKGKIILFIALVCFGTIIGWLAAILFFRGGPSFLASLIALFLSLPMSIFLLINILIQKKLPSWSGWELIMLYSLIAILFWYLISCLVVFAFNKFKEKKN